MLIGTSNAPKNQVQDKLAFTDSLRKILTSEDRTYFKERFNISKMQVHLASIQKLNAQL